MLIFLVHMHTQARLLLLRGFSPLFALSFMPLSYCDDDYCEHESAFASGVLSIPSIIWIRVR